MGTENSITAASITQWNIKAFDKTAESSGEKEIHLQFHNGTSKAFKLKNTDADAAMKTFIEQKKLNDMMGTRNSYCDAVQCYKKSEVESTQGDASRLYLHGLAFLEKQLHKSIFAEFTAQLNIHSKEPTQQQIEEIRGIAHQLSFIMILSKHVLAIPELSSQQKELVSNLIESVSQLSHFKSPENLLGVYQLAKPLDLSVYVSAYTDLTIHHVVDDSLPHDSDSELCEFLNCVNRFIIDDLKLYHPISNQHAKEVGQCFSESFLHAVEIGSGRGQLQAILNNFGLNVELGGDIETPLLPWPNSVVKNQSLTFQLQDLASNTLLLCSQPTPEMLDDFIKSGKELFVFFSGNCQIYNQRHLSQVQARLLRFEHYPIHHPFSAPCFVGFNINEQEFQKKLDELPPQYVEVDNATPEGVTLINKLYTDENN